MKAKPLYVRVRKNQWGNLRGFRTCQPSQELGCDEHRATEWLMDQQDAGYLIHRDSYITAAQVAELRQRLG
jgi:hypothetical protein